VRTLAWGMPITSAAMQPPYSCESRTMRSGCHAWAIVSRSGTIVRAYTPTKMFGNAQYLTAAPICGAPGKSSPPERPRSSKPAGKAGKPARSTVVTKEEAHANATSCPAVTAARAMGMSGWKWPDIWSVVKSIRIARSFPGAWPGAPLHHGMPPEVDAGEEKHLHGTDPRRQRQLGWRSRPGSSVDGTVEFCRDGYIAVYNHAKH